MFHIGLSRFLIPVLYIFGNLGFQFVYRVVLGSSRRAKEEICIAELEAEQRPPVMAELWGSPRVLCPRTLPPSPVPPPDQ